MTIVGAYLRTRDWQRWNSTQAVAEFARYNDYGVNTIFAEADHYRSDIIGTARDQGLRFMGGLKCFNNNDALVSYPELHPIWAEEAARSRSPMCCWDAPTARERGHWLGAAQHCP